MNPWENDYYEPKTIIQQPQIKHDSLIDGLVVPALQAVITAVLSGLAAGSLAYWLNWPYWGIGLTAACLAALSSWLSYRSRWAYVLETMLGVDLNRDGRIGAPPIVQPVQALPETITVHLTKNEGQEGAFIPLPHPEKIPALAATILEGRAYTQTALVSGNILKREEYDTIKNAMLSAGLMRYKNPDAPNAGIVVTAAGRAVLRRFLPVKAPPHPTDDSE